MEKEIIEEEIDLRDYLEVIQKNKSLILTFIFAFLVISGSFSYFVQQDNYQTDAVIYIKNLPADVNNFGFYYSTDVIISTMTSSEVISKTVEQSGLDDSFKNSKLPNESAATWLKENIKIIQNENNNNLLNLELKGSLEPEILQKTLKTYIDVVGVENRKRFSHDLEAEKKMIGLLIADLLEQRTKISLAMEETVYENSSDKTLMIMNLMNQNSHLNAIDDRLNTLQKTKMNLEFIASPYFELIDVISSPSLPVEPVGLSKGMNIAIAGILGLFTGIIAAFFKNYLEGTRSS